MTTARLTLLVLYSDHVEECRAFYSRLGFAFDLEQHGHGPEHYAAVLLGGMVIEIYPATDERRVGAVRLGIDVEGTSLRPPLEPGRHVLTDPDGRKVDVHTT